MSFPKVYIIVLNWNGLSDTVECLESVYRLDYPNFEVVVVDNGSVDDPAPVVRAQFPRASLLMNRENLGYTGGNNVGIRHAMRNGGDYIWLLNNDTTVDSTCLTRLVATAGGERVALVSPTIYYYDSPTRKQFCGSCIDMADLSLSFPDRSVPSPAAFTTGPNVCLWGTALLIKAAVAEQIGVLDERYFAYWEDTDYSLRTRQAGYVNRLAPSASVYHKAAPPDSIRPGRHYHYYMERNRILLAKRHLGAGARVAIYRRQLANLAITLQSYRDLGALEAADARLHGFIDGLCSVTGPMPTEQFKVVARVMSSVLSWHPYFLARALRAELRPFRSRLLFRRGPRS